MPDAGPLPPDASIPPVPDAGPDPDKPCAEYGQICGVAGDCCSSVPCTDGFCEFIADPCDPVLCPDAAGFVCTQVDGNDACVVPCAEQADCDLFQLECTGTDDNDDSYCTAPAPDPCTEGEPCEIEGAGQFGTCTDGVPGVGPAVTTRKVAMRWRRSKGDRPSETVWTLL